MHSPLQELPHLIYDLDSPYHFWVNNYVYIQNSLKDGDAVMTGTCDLNSLKVSRSDCYCSCASKLKLSVCSQCCMPD